MAWDDFETNFSYLLMGKSKPNEFKAYLSVMVLLVFYFRTRGNCSMRVMKITVGNRNSRITTRTIRMLVTWLKMEVITIIMIRSIYLFSMQVDSYHSILIYLYIVFEYMKIDCLY